jgi:hypothetical protein
MRPTIPEILSGLAVILEQTVAPGVTGYPAEALGTVVSTLAVLADRHDDVIAFLGWDNESTARLLAGAGVPVPDIAGEALEVRNRRLRGLLESAVPALGADPEARRAMVGHFRERATRYPLSFPFAPGGAHADTAR